MFKILKYGAEGKEVVEAQVMLQRAGSKVKATGKYTIGMIAAVRAFQKKNGLEVTGRLDSKTMRKLRPYGRKTTKK